jgi:hypothetical protein
MNADSPRTLGLLLLSAALVPAAATGNSAGRSGGGCNGCHSGGAAPQVLITSATTVARGASIPVTFEILTGGIVGGVDAYLDVGSTTAQLVSPGTGLKLVAGALGNEVTHSAPRNLATSRSFTFSFAAALGATCDSTVTLTTWGLAANNNGTVSGDFGAADTHAITITCPPPTLATTASAGIVLGAGQLTDSAFVSGRVNAQPGATLDFRLYGPDDAGCTAAPVFSALGVAQPVANGAVASPAFTPAFAGTYRWRVSYSGDANNAAVAAPCNAPNESTVVAKASPSISGSPSPGIALGTGTLSNAARVVGRVNAQPGATLAFRLYGTNDSACTGTPVFEALGVPYGPASGTITSAAYTPARAGTYHWRVTYSGDANNAGGTTSCASGEAIVTRAAPSLSTIASGDVPLGGAVMDSATVSGRVAPEPGATIDFRLYGPNDATCAGAPVFESLAVGYPTAGGSVNSASFVPLAPGTYRWRASYNGDTNNLPVAAPCNDTNENVMVGVAATDALYANGFE